MYVTWIASLMRCGQRSTVGRSTDMERDDERGRRGEGRDCPQLVPRGPTREVAPPVALDVGAVRLDSRQRFVTRHVVGDGQQDRADEVQHGAGEEVRGKAFVPRQERPYRQDTTSH